MPRSDVICPVLLVGTIDGIDYWNGEEYSDNQNCIDQETSYLMATDLTATAGCSNNPACVPLSRKDLEKQMNDLEMEDSTKDEQAVYPRIIFIHNNLAVTGHRVIDDSTAAFLLNNTLKHSQVANQGAFNLNGRTIRLWKVTVDPRDAPPRAKGLGSGAVFGVGFEVQNCQSVETTQLTLLAGSQGTRHLRVNIPGDSTLYHVITS